jgi:hypothetical protein
MEAARQVCEEAKEPGAPAEIERGRTEEGRSGEESGVKVKVGIGRQVYFKANSHHARS